MFYSPAPPNEGVRVAGICEGRVVIVTGAGRGIGRAHALMFAAEGAKVVVNDLGAEVDGAGSSTGPAGEVVDQIRASGGEAVANGDDVASWDGAANLIRSTVERFGRVDVLVNNAGILRDRMLVNMTEAEWDAVIRVHLKGTFGPAHFAAEHWRDRAKAGEQVNARIVNTTSVSGIFGNPGQSNYGAAKAGIAAFTVIAAKELSRYGITVNAIAPTARTRMTESIGFGKVEIAAGAFDFLAPENMSPLVVWLGSAESAHVTGRVFEVSGGRITLADGWRRGPTREKGARWNPGELGAVVSELVAGAAPVEPVSL